MIEIDENKIFVSGKEIEFDFSILKYIIYGDLVIILLDIPKDVNQYNNLYAVNSATGKIYWEVEDLKNYLDNPTPYHSLELMNNNISVWDWYGWQYFISPDTGEIIFRRLVK